MAPRRPDHLYHAHHLWKFYRCNPRSTMLLFVPEFAKGERNKDDNAPLQYPARCSTQAEEMVKYVLFDGHVAHHSIVWCDSGTAISGGRSRFTDFEHSQMLASLE